MSNLDKDIGVPTGASAGACGTVTCPSCRARWRWSRAAAARVHVRCSRCAAVFEATPPTRAYRIRNVKPIPATLIGPPGAVHVTAQISGAASALRVGMDDPTLADRIARSSLNERAAGGPAAWSWTVVAPDDAEPATPTIDADAELPTETAAEATIEDPTPAEPVVAAEPVASPEPVVSPEPVDRPAAGPASLREAPLAGPPVDPPAGARPDPAPTPPSVPAVAAAAAEPLTEVSGDIGVDWAFEDGDDDDTAPDFPLPGAGRDDVAASLDEEPGRARAGAASAIAGFVVVFGFAAAGACAAWFAAEPLASTMSRWTELWPPLSGWKVSADPFFWAAPGAATGLLVAWMWVRWMQRRR